MVQNLTRLYSGMKAFTPRQLNGLIVFPLISTGIYSYPKEEAAKIAAQSARDFLEDEPGTTLEEIVFCTFAPQDKKLMDELLL